MRYIIGVVLILFISLFFIGQASANIISFEEQYQDYLGNWYKYTVARGIS